MSLDEHTPRIRLATEHDLDELCALTNWAIRETWAHFREEPVSIEEIQADLRAAREHYPWLVARDGRGMFLGFSKASAWKPRSAYGWTTETSVYVEPGSQRRGVGRALLDPLVERLAGQGFRTLLAVIALPNEPSERLHQKLGYERAGVLRGVGFKAGSWHDTAIWQRELFPASAPTPAAPRAVEDAS